MSSDLTVDIENHQNFMMNNNNNSSDRLGFMAIDQDGEWDISLFDELDDLPDADELIQALEHAGYATEVPELDFDIDLPPWNGAATGSTCTDGEVSVDSLSPAHTLSSVPSPASVEALSPYSYSDEALSPQSQPSPVSVCSESSGYSEAPTAAKRAPKRTSLTPRAKPAQTAKRPIQLSTKVSIQPKPLLTALPLAHSAPPLQAKTIIIQPLHATMLPVVKPAPISIQPAPPPGRPMVLPQPGQVLQIQTPQSVGGHVVTMPTLSQDVAVTGTVAAPQMVSVTLGRTPSSDDDSKVSQRQQRMIKNRESASLSRKKKKEYLLTLEARLKLALTENELLKNENGSLKRQLEGMLAENTVLQTISPKRKAVCLMAVLVFLVLNVGPTSLFQGGPGSQLLTGPGSQLHTGPVRHLLAIPQEDKAEVVPEHPTSSPADSSSEDKELMLVKDLILRPPPPCLPPVNRTKCMELAQELSVWVRRHEVEQTKSRHMNNNNQHKPNSTILKTTDEEVDIAPVDQYTVQYTEPTEEKSPGSELQVYYAPHRTYSDFFDEINRRGDTFYVVSFRRDHLLLPATNHNKGSRPKMSVVLPAMNINESIIPDKGFEIMMQIDCEVTNTRILHIKSSTIPPLLRVNHTDTFYKPSPAESQATPPVGVLMGSA